MALSNFISGAISGISNLFDGGHTERKNARSIADYQSQLNDVATEKQNDWNLQQWNRQNVYNEQMWNKQNAYNEKQRDIENAYNSPIQQVQRLREAGINPASAFGQGVASSSTVSSNAPSSSSAITSAPYTPADFASAMAAGNTSFNNQIALQGLLANNAKLLSEANLNDKKAEGQESENKYIDAIRQGQITLNDANVTVANANAKLSEQECIKFQQEVTESEARIKSIQQSINESVEKMSNISQDTLNKTLEYMQNQGLYNKRVAQIESEIAKNYASANQSNVSAQTSREIVKATCDLYRSMVGVNESNAKSIDLKNIYQNVLNKFAPRQFREQLQNAVFTNSGLMMQNEKFQIGLDDYKDIHTFKKYADVTNDILDISSKTMDNLLKPISPGMKVLDALE